MSQILKNKMEVYELHKRCGFTDPYGKVKMLFIYSVINIKPFPSKLFGNDLVEITYKQLDPDTANVEIHIDLVCEPIEHVQKKLFEVMPIEMKRTFIESISDLDMFSIKVVDKQK